MHGKYQRNSRTRDVCIRVCRYDMTPHADRDTSPQWHWMTSILSSKPWMRRQLGGRPKPTSEPLAKVNLHKAAGPEYTWTGTQGMLENVLANTCNLHQVLSQLLNKKTYTHCLCNSNIHHNNSSRDGMDMWHPLHSALALLTHMNQECSTKYDISWMKLVQHSSVKTTNCLSPRWLMTSDFRKTNSAQHLFLINDSCQKSGAPAPPDLTWTRRLSSISTAFTVCRDTDDPPWPCWFLF